jgi:hypothetical protein
MSQSKKITESEAAELFESPFGSREFQRSRMRLLRTSALIFASYFEQERGEFKSKSTCHLFGIDRNDV